MGYITAVTDRSALDIANRTSKAFWNVADFERVYGNSQLVNSLAAIMLDTPIVFNECTIPTITTIPSLVSGPTNFNRFLANIERTRLAVAGESIPGTETEIKDDYEAGAGKVAPKYTDANLWESVIDAIWEHFDGPDLDVCPTLTGNLTIATGAQAVYVDCIDAANFDIDIQGTGSLVII